MSTYVETCSDCQDLFKEDDLVYELRRGTATRDRGRESAPCDLILEDKESLFTFCSNCYEDMITHTQVR